MRKAVVRRLGDMLHRECDMAERSVRAGRDCMRKSRGEWFEQRRRASAIDRVPSVHRVVHGEGAQGEGGMLHRECDMTRRSVHESSWPGWHELIQAEVDFFARSQKSATFEKLT